MRLLPANGDGFVAPGDVLQVINYINLHGNHGEGESVELAEGTEWLPIPSPRSVDRVELPQELRTSQPPIRDESSEDILFEPSRSSGDLSAARLNLVEEQE